MFMFHFFNFQTNVLHHLFKSKFFIERKEAMGRLEFWIWLGEFGQWLDKSSANVKINIVTSVDKSTGNSYQKIRHLVDKSTRIWKI